MANIFSTIGNNIEKEKKDKKKFIEKYWKLPASERIHYDLFEKRITDNSYFFDLTWLYIRIVFIITIGMILASLYYPPIWHIWFKKEVLSNIISILGLILGLDFIGMFVSIISIPKQKEKLNKRFKLC